MNLLNKLLWLLIAFSVIAHAEEEPASKMAVSAPNAYIASDSEGFSTYKYNAGFLPLYEHGEKYTGVSYQHNYFTQSGWDSSAEIYTLLTKAINPRTGLGYNANIGYNLQNLILSLT